MSSLVTEREVIHGILQAPNPNDHCLCYVRHIKNINIQQTAVASKYTDINPTTKQVHVEAQKFLAELRDERVPAKLRLQNIRRSTVEWAGREGMDTMAHGQYLKEFCADFYSSVTSMVDHAMRKQAKFRDAFFVSALCSVGCWPGAAGGRVVCREYWVFKYRIFKIPCS